MYRPIATYCSVQSAKHLLCVTVRFHLEFLSQATFAGKANSDRAVLLSRLIMSVEFAEKFARAVVFHCSALLDMYMSVK